MATFHGKEFKIDQKNPAQKSPQSRIIEKVAVKSAIAIAGELAIFSLEMRNTLETRTTRARSGSLTLGILMTLSSLAICCCLAPAAPAKHGNVPERLYPGTDRPWQVPYPVAPAQPPESPIAPPGEEQFFPIRQDGQLFMFNADVEPNLTDRLNRYYYKPGWRGEVWEPFDQYDLPERSSRTMAIWPEYDQFSMYRKLNNVNSTLERWSGFGP